jgi:hypothetical protein
MDMLEMNIVAVLYRTFSEMPTLTTVPVCFAASWRSCWMRLG